VIPFQLFGDLSPTMKRDQVKPPVRCFFFVLGRYCERESSRRARGDLTCVEGCYRCLKGCHMPVRKSTSLGEASRNLQEVRPREIRL
jgi:hypothetical protein